VIRKNADQPGNVNAAAGRHRSISPKLNERSNHRSVDPSAVDLASIRRCRRRRVGPSTGHPLRGGAHRVEPPNPCSPPSIINKRAGARIRFLSAKTPLNPESIETINTPRQRKRPAVNPFEATGKKNAVEIPRRPRGRKASTARDKETTCQRKNGQHAPATKFENFDSTRARTTPRKDIKRQEPGWHKTP